MSKSPVSRRSYKVIVATFAALCVLPSAQANFSCWGQVGYLGVDGGGTLFVAVAGSTPIHGICSIETQANYGFTVASCKAAYASILSARLAGKGIVLYYNDDRLSCSTIPSWGAVPSTYFVEGPF